MRKQFQPEVQELESRVVPATWAAMGPQPETSYDLGDQVTGAVSGRISSIAIAKNFSGMNDDMIYVGTASGGVWQASTVHDPNFEKPGWRAATEIASLRDRNGQPITDRASLLGVNNIGSIAVDPNHPSVIYVGTGEASFGAGSASGAGILKSTNDGQTWTVWTKFSAGMSVGDIIVDPNDNTGGLCLAA